MPVQASTAGWWDSTGQSSARRPPASSGPAEGSRSCAGCHASIYYQWGSTPHAREASLGCEDCHGPGGRHRRRPSSGNIVRESDISRCLSCHTPASSPGFRRNFSRYQREVHPSFSRMETHWANTFAETLESGRPVEMELFVMIDCPYGIEAERRLLPLALAFPEQLHLKVTFMPEAGLLSATAGQRLSPDCLPEYDLSLSGEPAEPAGLDSLEEQMRQVLIREYMPGRFADYVLNRLELPPEAPWTEVAESAGLEPALVEEWLRAGQGLELLRQDRERYRQLGIFASPTLLVEGREYPGALASNVLFRQWCAAAGQEQAFCQSLPECSSDADCDAPREYCAHPGGARARCVERPDAPVTLTILDGLECRSCFSDLVIASARQLFRRTTVRWLEVASRRGRRLAERHGLERVPAYFFSPSIEASTPAFEDLKPILRKTADGYLLEPTLLEAPLLWRRERQAGRLELWFHPGEPASDEAEAGWAEWLSSADRHLKADVHYVIDDPTAFLQPHFSLETVPGSNTLALSPRLSSAQLDLLRRYALWRLAPEALARYLQDDKRLPEDFQPPKGWEEALATTAPDALRGDIRLSLRRPFIEAGGGALIHNQVWIPRADAGTIPRIFYELRGR